MGTRYTVLEKHYQRHACERSSGRLGWLPAGAVAATLRFATSPRLAVPRSNEFHVRPRPGRIPTRNGSHEMMREGPLALVGLFDRATLAATATPPTAQAGSGERPNPHVLTLSVMEKGLLRSTKCPLRNKPRQERAGCPVRAPARARTRWRPGRRAAWGAGWLMSGPAEEEGEQRRREAVMIAESGTVCFNGQSLSVVELLSELRRVRAGEG